MPNYVRVNNSKITILSTHETHELSHIIMYEIMYAIWWWSISCANNQIINLNSLITLSIWMFLYESEHFAQMFPYHWLVRFTFVCANKRHNSNSWILQQLKCNYLFSNFHLSSFSDSGPTHFSLQNSFTTSIFTIGSLLFFSPSPPILTPISNQNSIITTRN